MIWVLCVRKTRIFGVYSASRKTLRKGAGFSLTWRWVNILKGVSSRLLRKERRDFETRY
jgi:hypothetical protein